MDIAHFIYPFINLYSFNTGSRKKRRTVSRNSRKTRSHEGQSHVQSHRESELKRTLEITQCLAFHVESLRTGKCPSMLSGHSGMRIQVVLIPSSVLFLPPHTSGASGLLFKIAMETVVPGDSEKRHKSFHLSLGLNFRTPLGIQIPQADLELLLKNYSEELAVRNLSDILDLSPFHFQLPLFIINENVLKIQELNITEL